MQLSFINHNQDIKTEIPGLNYISEYITIKKENELINLIDKQPWSNEIKRQVQHYGWKYDYKTKKITHNLKIGSLPEWLHEISHELKQKNIFKENPDQVIINEYLPGQGISPHVDCASCFGETIASLSLNSGCMMDFFDKETSENPSKFLENRSLLILRNDARYRWQHSIPARKSDTVNSVTIERKRRISLTFRNVITD